MVESDFYRHEAGRKYFSDQITSVRYCVQETANYDVLFSYLTCHNYDHHWDVTKNLLPHRNVIAAMKHEITTFAVVQKNKRGLELAVEKAKQRMARYQVTPNMMIMAPETQLYVTMVPPERRSYADGGERAVSEYRSYAGNEPWQSFRGLSVYTASPFDNGDNVDTLQMLRRQTQIGEFYVMKPPNVWEGTLPGTYMNLMIFDEAKDGFAHISFREAMMHAMPWKLFDSGGGSLPANQDLLKLKGYDKQIKKSLTAIGASGAKEPDGAKETYFQTFKYTEPEFLKLVDFVEAGVWIPLQLVIARPFIEHAMLSAIVTVAGGDTGNTLFGPADMQVSANTTVKTIEAHYTCHMKTVITRPQNVMVMRDIQCDGYIAGADATWFGDVYASDNSSAKLDPDFIANDIRERLDFDREHDNKYASMLAFVCPAGENAQCVQDNAFSLSASALPWDIGNGQLGEVNFPGGRKFFDAYNKLFELSYITAGNDPASIQNRDFIRNGTYNNAVCLLGPSRGYSPFTASFFDLTAGQGHFGPDALPGDARWRRGEDIDVESARGALVGVEALAESKRALHRLRP